MMIVPRSFSNTHHQAESGSYVEKSESGKVVTRTKSRSPRAGSLATPPASSPATSPTRSSTRSHNASVSPSRPSCSAQTTTQNDTRSDPVRIPSRASVRLQEAPRQSISQEIRNAGPLAYHSARPTRESARDVLSSTSIPQRRKPRTRPSQRLPKGDYVADFSKLLMEDVHSTRGLLPRSLSASNLDGLFGNMDELLGDGQIIVGSEPLDELRLTARSISSDSLSTLVSPDECETNELVSPPSSIHRESSDRRMRHLATSEDCSEDHPLSWRDTEDTLRAGSPPDLVSSLPKPLPQGRKGTRKPSSFKSSLTASLKAIRNVAQTVSLRSSSASVIPPEDVMAQSFFDIQPALTDDRRPPPTSDLPSPEVRRYLNPPPLESAAQLHTWQEHRHSQPLPPAEPKKKRGSKNKQVKPVPGYGSLTRGLPPVVQLATCLPPSVRTAHASSPPIWLAPDGTPSNKNTSLPLLYDPDSSKGATRLREPRENRDFLRIFVCEMQMRRGGKLSDNLSAGRARLWLPPVNDRAQGAKDGSSSTEQRTVERKSGAQRWTSWTSSEFDCN